MNSADITRLRLRNQFLTGKPAASPVQVVRHSGAVQSQDLPGALWGVGQRVRSASGASVLASYDEGEFVRTHILRPTWHFVASEDLRWMQALTSPRVHQLMAYRYRQLEIDAILMRTAKRVFTKALRDRTLLTRQELAAKLRAAGIALAGERLTFIVMWAELDALICSGPMRGKHSTYALCDERISTSRSLSGDEALVELVRRFFTSHGPAQVRDFVFWSGLTVASTKRGLEGAGADIFAFDLDGHTYYFAGHARSRKVNSPHIRLLPNYDEYLLAYRDGIHAGAAVDLSKLAGDDLSAHFVVLDGQVVGGWKRRLRADALEAEVTLFSKLNREARQALDEELLRYERFSGMPLRATIS